MKTLGQFFNPLTEARIVEWDHKESGPDAGELNAALASFSTPYVTTGIQTNTDSFVLMVTNDRVSQETAQELFDWREQQSYLGECGGRDDDYWVSLFNGMVNGEESAIKEAIALLRTHAIMEDEDGNPHPLALS